MLQERLACLCSLPLGIISIDLPGHTEKPSPTLEATRDGRGEAHGSSLLFSLPPPPLPTFSPNPNLHTRDISLELPAKRVYPTDLFHSIVHRKQNLKQRQRFEIKHTTG